MTLPTSLTSYPALFGQTAPGAAPASSRLMQWSSQAQAPAPVTPSPVPTPVAAPSAQAVELQIMSMAQELERLRQWATLWINQLFAPPTPAAPTPQPPKPGKPNDPAPPVKGGTVFKVSSFNILGSGHTAPGGDAKGYASGTTRVRWVDDVLKQKDVDVVGFQEMAQDQARAFLADAGQTYGLYPGPAKRKFASNTSIAWRKDKWDLVKGRTVDFVGHKGRTNPSAVVLLQNKETGQRVYFVNVHNAPGYSSGAQQHNRDAATARQVEVINELRRSGYPVIVTGDMNEKERVYNRFKQQAGMKASIENTKGQLPRQLFIDWIFGSEQVNFKGYQRDRSGLIRKISDHGMVVSQVRINR